MICERSWNTAVIIAWLATVAARIASTRLG